MADMWAFEFVEPKLAIDKTTTKVHSVVAYIDLYRRHSYGPDRNQYGQLLATQDGLLVVDDDGAVHLLEANPTGATELGSFRGVEDGLALNVPALAHGLLYLRTDRELVCYDLRRP